MKVSNFTESELNEYWNEGKIMFIAYRTLWQLHKSQNAGYYFQKIKTLTQPYTKRGRFYAVTPESITL